MDGYFYGWYFKCQSDTQTFAVIPAIHGTGISHGQNAKRTCSIQIITEDGAWTAAFPEAAFCRRGKRLSIGNSYFSEKGMRLSICAPGLVAEGRIAFENLTPLKYDIMGPFAFVPFMECRHSVWSMQHFVRGAVTINGKKYTFKKALGYWEGDSGRSFPEKYAWTQCLFPEGSLMLSVADIPLAGIHFTGIIGVVLWKGKEYRLATYLGAKAVRNCDGRLRIVQGDLELEARLTEKTGRALRAPKNGGMTRTIQESVACKAYYCFRKNGRTLFAFQTNQASFEYEYMA